MQTIRLIHHICDLLEKTIQHNLIFGFNTKALKILIVLEIIQTKNISIGSYISLSVDAAPTKLITRCMTLKIT